MFWHSILVLLVLPCVAAALGDCKYCVCACSHQKGGLMQSLTLYLPFACYLLLTLSISLFAAHRKQSKNMTSYFIGERKLGSGFLAMTLVATYMSASTFIGGPGAAYRFGLGWVLLALIQLPILWLTLGTIGPRIAQIGARLHAITLNDLIWARYQSRLLVILCACTLLLAFFAMAVVQFIGGARLLEYIAGLSYQQGLIVFAAITLIYTTFGGFKAVVWTDVIQGCIMLIGTLVLLGVVINQGGGVASLFVQLEKMDPQLLQPQGAEHFLSISLMLSFWILVGFGAICLPHCAARCLSVEPNKPMQRTIVIGTSISAVMLVALNLTGVLGRVLQPELTASDQIIPALIADCFSPLGMSIMLAVPMAAIMSTIDSLLLQTSATLVKDVAKHTGLVRITHTLQSARWPKMMTFFIGLAAIFCASAPPEMIIWLNLAALGALEAVFLWPVLCGLYWRHANRYGALASVFLGLGTYGYLIVFQVKIASLHAIIPTLVFAGLGMFLGSLFFKLPQPKSASVFFNPQHES